MDFYSERLVDQIQIQRHTGADSKWYCAGLGVGVFARRISSTLYVETFDEFFGFPNGKCLFIVHGSQIALKVLKFCLFWKSPKKSPKV